MSAAYDNFQASFINWSPISDYLRSGFQGTQGDQGIKGPTGGQTGYQGQVGAQGIPGLIGLAGITGIGAQGVMGSQGPQGGSIPIVNSTGLPNTNLGVIISQAGVWDSLGQKTPALQYNPGKNLLRASSQICAARSPVIANSGTKTLTAVELQSGIINNSAGLVPIVYTIDSAANILALYNSNLVIGDSWILKFVNPNGNSSTFSAGAGITLVGPPAKTQTSFTAVLAYNGSSTFNFYY